jgi:ankyrin repeat protein
MVSAWRGGHGGQTTCGEGCHPGGDVYLIRRLRSVAVLTAVILTAAGCSGGDPATPDTAPATTPAASTGPPQPPQPTPRPTKKTPAPKLDAKQQARLNQQLIAAAWDNDVRRAESLIIRGADVNAKDNTVQSAYLISTSEGYLELLNVTLKHGAHVDSKDSFNGTGLIRAADRGDADIAGRLVQAGVEIDHINNLGWTALHEAIILGDGSDRYVNTVWVLVAAGADYSCGHNVTRPHRFSTLRPGATTRSHSYCAPRWRPINQRKGRPIGACSLPLSAGTQPLRRWPFALGRVLRPATSWGAHHSRSP